MLHMLNVCLCMNTMQNSWQAVLAPLADWLSWLCWLYWLALDDVHLATYAGCICWFVSCLSWLVMLTIMAGNSGYVDWLCCRCWLARPAVYDGYAVWQGWMSLLYNWPCCLDHYAGLYSVLAS
jgi:hypothetical protein